MNPQRMPLSGTVDLNAGLDQSRLHGNPGLMLKTTATPSARSLQRHPRRYIQATRNSIDPDQPRLERISAAIRSAPDASAL